MPVTASDKKWQEEDDARTLAQAEQINADRVRLQGARAGAKRLLAEEEERARGMRKVARSTSSASSKERKTSTSDATNGFNTFERI